MGIIDLIMGWGVIDEETSISEAEFESLNKADKKTKTLSLLEEFIFPSKFSFLQAK